MSSPTGLELLTTSSDNRTVLPAYVVNVLSMQNRYLIQGGVEYSVQYTMRPEMSYTVASAFPPLDCNSRVILHQLFDLWLGFDA